MASIALLGNKDYESVLEKCPVSYDAELVYLWRRYSVGGIYE